MAARPTDGRDWSKRRRPGHDLLAAYGLPLTSDAPALFVAILGRMGLDQREYFGPISSVVTALLLGGFQNLQRIKEGRPLPKSVRQQIGWNLGRQARSRQDPLPLSDEELVTLVLADIQAALVASGFSVSRRPPGL